MVLKQIFELDQISLKIEHNIIGVGQVSHHLLPSVWNLSTVGMRVMRIQNQFLTKCPNLPNLDSKVLYFDNKSHILKEQVAL